FRGDVDSACTAQGYLTTNRFRLLPTDCQISRREANMNYQPEQAIEILRRTPSTLRALLAGLPDEWTRGSAGPGSWSAYDVVGHLLHGEQADWIARTRIILEYGQERPFDSFDRTAMMEKFKDYSLEQLLDAFAEARAQNLATLRGLNITPEKLA